MRRLRLSAYVIILYMKILGIDTSCDETAAAVIENGTTVLSNQVASQVEVHARYGGIVPEVASRQHNLAIIPVIKQAITGAGLSWDDLDAIAVTYGPGLAGSLLIGVNTAKAISLARSIPLIGINHLEGHIYANWLADDKPDDTKLFPLLCLIASGGHSDLVLMKDHGAYTLLGRTRDDAPGEAFDKAARILGLGHPGGPAIQKAAESVAAKGGASGGASIELPRSWLKGTNDFSFSGIKTALLRLVEAGKVTSIADAAASFQEAIADVLVTKTIAAAKEYGVKNILLAGGVAANSLLRQRLTESSPLPVLIPPLKFCTDNAAMIAACGCFRFRSDNPGGMDLDVIPNLKIG